MSKFNKIYTEAIENYAQDFFGQIDESGAGLSRVLQKISGSNFLVISASRGKYSKKENHKRNNELLKFLKQELGQKLGAYKIIGHWKECSEPLKDGETIKDCQKITNQLEESWLISKPSDVSIADFNIAAQKACRKYDQDAYIIKENVVLLKGKDGEMWDKLGKADMSALKTGFGKILDVQGYSELAKMRKRGRIHNIVFENISLVIPKDNISSKRIFSAMNILY